MNSDDEIVDGLNDRASLIAMRRRQAKIGREMQEVAAHAFRELQQKAAAGELNLSADDVRILFDLGCRMERGDLGKEIASSEIEEPKPAKLN